MQPEIDGVVIGSSAFQASHLASASLHIGFGVEKVLGEDAVVVGEQAALRDARLLGEEDVSGRAGRSPPRIPWRRRGCRGPVAVAFIQCRGD